MNLLLTLLLGHLLADFPLQTNRLAKLKQSCWTGVLLHVGIYVAVSALLLRDPFTYWPLLLGLGAAHFMIDGLKLLCPLQNALLCFIIDQLLHLLTVGSAAYLAHQLWRPVPTGILLTPFLTVAVAVAAGLGVMVFCWVWVTHSGMEQGALARWTKGQMLACEQRIGLGLVGLIFVTELVKRL